MSSFFQAETPGSILVQNKIVLLYKSRRCHSFHSTVELSQILLIKASDKNSLCLLHGRALYIFELRVFSLGVKSHLEHQCSAQTNRPFSPFSILVNTNKSQFGLRVQKLIWHIIHRSQITGSANSQACFGCWFFFYLHLYPTWKENRQDIFVHSATICI